MKHLYQSLFLLLAILLPAIATAHDFEVDGIYYNINGNTATVTYNGTNSWSHNTYSGTVTIPATVTYNGTTYSVTTIGYNAFFGCSGLTSVTIPNSVTTIGENAFSGCSGLTSVEIPNSVTNIGEAAFTGTAWLDNQPDGLVYAGLIAYKYKGTMPDGTSISIKEGTLSISDGAFGACSGLTSVIIPNSVTTIGHDAFGACSGLTSVTIPNSVTDIGYRAFMDCSSLSSVTIPNSVTTIEWNTFGGCSSLSSVTIPNSVTTIGFEAFSGCSGLTSVTLGNSVSSIEEYAFSGCSSLTGVYITDLEAWCRIIFRSENFYDSYSNPCRYAHHLYLNGEEIKNLNIPNSITSIGDFAFYGCSSITSATIPNTVTSIGDCAFYGCSSLTSITIPESVSSIGHFAFSGCESVETLNYNAVSCVLKGVSDVSGTGDGFGYTVFPSSIVNLNFGNSVRHIPRCIAYRFSNLTSVTIPASVTSIGYRAFSYCESLETINYNAINCTFYDEFGTDMYLELMDSPFCSNVVINIGDGVERIPAFFAYNLENLTVTIPYSVTSIGYNAFVDCSGPIDVFCFIPDPSQVVMGNNVFYNYYGYSDRTLHVLPGTMDVYQVNENWYPYFGQIVEIEPILVSEIELDCAAAVVIEGETLQLTAAISPMDVANRTLAWSSSNLAVATVDDSGLVTAHSVGTATITAMTTDGSNLSASCVVTVKSLSATECLSMPDGEVLHGEAITIPVRMTNAATVLAFQTDIFLPEGFAIDTNEDNEPIVTPSSRLTDDHIIMTQVANNGAVRVVCYTPTMQPISGNEGDLFYITVNVPADAAGDYAVYLRNSRLTIDDFTEVRIPDAGAVIDVKTYIPGDVNDTHSVNVADIVTTVRYVLDMDPSPFIFDAADMNGDGEVTVTDIMLIARQILYPTMNAPRQAPALSANGDRMSGEGITLSAGETRTVSINLDNARDYSAFQLDLRLPEGLTATNFRLTERAASHNLEVNTLRNGNVRALCYTPAIEAIDGNSGAVLTFDVTATGTVVGDITVDGIELVTTACQGVRLDAFTIGVQTATAVTELTSGKTVAKVEYFNLAGQRLTHPATGVTLIVTTYTDGTRTTTKRLD